MYSLFHDRNFIGVGLVYGIFLVFFWVQPKLIQRAETSIIDYYFQLSTIQKPKNNPIVIVAIDYDSLQEEGSWPWPSHKVARLLDTISRQKARTIATSFLFSSSEENVLKNAISWFKQKNLNVPIILQSLEKYAKEDRYLLQVLASTPTVMGYQVDANDAFFFNDFYRNDQLDLILANAYQGIDAADWSLMNVGKVHSIKKNEYSETVNGAYSGFIRLMPDALTKVREIPLMLNYQGYLLSPLALAALQHWQGYAVLKAEVRTGHIDIHIAENIVTTSSEGLFRILFYSEPETFQVISARDVLSGKTSRQDFEGKLVLLGLTAKGLEPRYQTPYHKQVSTVEIQANIIANILNDQVLKHATPQRLLEFLLITLIAVLYAFFGHVLVRRYFGMLSTLMFSLILLMAYVSFQYGMVIYIVLPVFTLISCFVVLTIMNYGAELKQRLRLRHTFESFIDPAVVTDVMDHHQLTELGGDERNMSVMFVDVAGFTAISEMLSPQDTVRYINLFFQEATPVIFKHKGTIDRLTGDGLIVLFGAPIHDDDHAERACKAALDIQQALYKARNVFSDINCPLSIRVGINSGRMVVGNIGSAHRLHYTFMGDAGNTASRLESLNKQYGSQRMIGESTWQEVGHEFTCREVDTVILVGKTESIKVYELLGDKHSYDYWEPMLVSYASALRLYRLGYFKEAAVIFRSGGEQFEDIVAIHMAKRCDDLSTRSSLEWHGVWRTVRK
ncbi:MAG: adenylate/guanylate cyclase domain-containing protein [Mariprofundaceae bacterium]|nr:adenylate/guanylate cyclase domain-containing protein [Mariprofundaceae bacterium]